MLEGNPGCTGCRKPCQYNGLNMAAWKYKQQNKQHRYSCNSSHIRITKINSLRYELGMLLKDPSASYEEIAMVEAELGRLNLELLKDRSL